MSYRDFLDSTTGKITGFAVSTAFIVAVGFLAMNFAEGSVVGEHHRPSFGDCGYSHENGDVQGSCGEQRGEINTFESGFGGSELVSGAYQGGEPVPKYFWVRMTGIAVEGEEKAPQFWWLYRNDFLAEPAREDIQEGNFPDDADLYNGDLKWNQDIKQGLERATVCRASIRPAAQGEVYIETTEGQQAFNDEPDADELYIGEMVPEPVQVTADEVMFTEQYMACRFDFTEVMNKGMSLDGYFKSWSGREIMIGGGGDEGSTSFDVDIGMDRDGDGILLENDECPTEAGLQEKNGCPNQASEIVEINGPRNATVGSQVEYSVEVSNPDDDPTTVSWGNGETGKTASYSWNSTGSKEVTVSADDGFNTSSRSLSVQVGEAPEPPSPLEALSSFFSGLLDILWYSG